MKRGSVTNRWLDHHIGIPVLFLTSVLSRRREFPQRIDRIGVLASTTLGDTLLNSAALRDLRQRYPEAHIIFFYASTNAAAAELLPCVDELRHIDLTTPGKTIRALRACKLDLMLDFTSWQRLTALYSAMSAAKYRVGFYTPRQHRHWHYDKTAFHSPQLHEVENFRSLLRVLDIKGRSEPELEAPWLKDVQVAREEEVIVFHAWATGDRHFLREWPQANWIKLALELSGPKTRFVITGAPAQTPRSEGLCRALADAGLRCSVFSGSPGLRGLSILLRTASLVVSVNTGVMHLAAILGTPTIALNGPNSSHRWGPRGPRAISVDPSEGGGGFLHLGFEFDGNPADTMERTRVEDVVYAATELLPRLSKAVSHAELQTTAG